MTALLAATVLSLFATAGHAETRKPQTAASSKATPQATAPRAKRKAPPPEPAPKPLTVEDIGPGQLDVAGRVLTGDADCEFKQQVSVLPVDGMPGYFNVTHLRKRYRMLPRETATGAVRLEDPDTGIVWLQIPAKSMLMNARVGQRMIDNCTHAEQRAAVNAAAGAAQSLGIDPAKAPPAAAAPPAAEVSAAAAVPGASAVAAVAAASAVAAAPEASVVAATPAMPATSAASAASPVPAAMAAASAPTSR